MWAAFLFFKTLVNHSGHEKFSLWKIPIRWVCRAACPVEVDPPDEQNRCNSHCLDHGSGTSSILQGEGNYLVVSTHLKNISQNGNLPQIGVIIKNIWNHHLGKIKKKNRWIPFLASTSTRLTLQKYFCRAKSWCFLNRLWEFPGDPWRLGGKIRAQALGQGIRWSHHPGTLMKVTETQKESHLPTIPFLRGFYSTYLSDLVYLPQPRHVRYHTVVQNHNCSACATTHSSSPTFQQLTIHIWRIKLHVWELNDCRHIVFTCILLGSWSFSIQIAIRCITANSWYQSFYDVSLSNSWYSSISEVPVLHATHHVSSQLQG